MRKTFAFVLATAFVATLPSLASAKPRHYRHRTPVVVDSNDAGPRLLGDALHQLVVPLQTTFGSRGDLPERRYRHHRRRIARAPS
jgi:hypothetical protein